MIILGHGWILHAVILMRLRGELNAVWFRNDGHAFSFCFFVFFDTINSS